MSSSYGTAQEGVTGAQQPSNGDRKTETAPLLGKPPPIEALQRSIWSKLTFRWFTPILYQGNAKKKLDQDDLELVPLPADCQTTQVNDTFEHYWNEELAKSDPSLVRALFRSFGAEFMKGGLLKLIHDLCLFVGPQVLHAMIVFLRNPNAPLWHGLALTAAVTLSQINMSLCLRHYFFKVGMCDD